MAGNLARGGPCAACLSTALIPVTLVTASRRLARGKGIIVRLGVATLSLSFLLLAGASVHAQAPPPAPPEASRPTPGIAQSFVNWLHHVAGIAPHRRQRSMPPLPRPRPAELAATSDAPDNAPAAQLHSLGAQKPTRPLSRLRPYVARRIRRHLRMQQGRAKKALCCGSLATSADAPLKRPASRANYRVSIRVPHCSVAEIRRAPARWRRGR